MFFFEIVKLVKLQYKVICSNFLKYNTDRKYKNWQNATTTYIYTLFVDKFFKSLFEIQKLLDSRVVGEFSKNL